ncbi:hypothetical protein GGR58DRAFT_504263 [Xylaria digitata]|nr:hypothetical protein GGR58DRAFT_504263 [Xylaria digitata]
MATYYISFWMTPLSNYSGPMFYLGDTDVELVNYIDSWEMAAGTILATLTIGGNDVGFSDLVWYCVITPSTFYWGSTNRKNCINADNEARAMIEDEGLDARGKAELDFDWPAERTVYLSQGLRNEINDLVYGVNTAIQSAVDASNAAWGGSRVHYVDAAEPNGTLAQSYGNANAAIATGDVSVVDVEW